MSATKLAGSSRFNYIDGRIEKKTTPKKNVIEHGKIFNRHVEACTIADHFNLGRDLSLIESTLIRGEYYRKSIEDYRHFMDVTSRPNPINKRIYKLNKAKVRKKMGAFCRLASSRQFIGFYSISFPSSACDDVLYTIFNKWLTNLRKTYGLRSYIWVAERQNNKTLHFHMLTNNWLPIQEINRAMATAINGEVHKNNLTWGNSSLSAYNGVDVDSPQFPKKRQAESRAEYRARQARAKHTKTSNVLKWISSYMIKYVTKNDVEFNRLAYHSSRDISQLFTSQIINENHIDRFIDHLPDDADDYYIFENKDIVCMSFRFSPSDDLYKYIDSINERLYNSYDNTETTPPK